MNWPLFQLDGEFDLQSKYCCDRVVKKFCTLEYKKKANNIWKWGLYLQYKLLLVWSQPITATNLTSRGYNLSGQFGISNVMKNQIFQSHSSHWLWLHASPPSAQLMESNYMVLLCGLCTCITDYASTSSAYILQFISFKIQKNPQPKL